MHMPSQFLGVSDIRTHAIANPNAWCSIKHTVPVLFRRSLRVQNNMRKP
jgi:hypothetical protein